MSVAEVMSGAVCCCCVFVGMRVGVFVFSVAWFEFSRRSAMRIPL